MAAMTAPDCPAVIDQIRESVLQGSVEHTAKALHKLKGMLSTFDSEGVVLEIQEMLDQARLGNLAEVGLAFEQHVHEINGMVSVVKGLSKPNQS
ncbi:MAG: hypothetical protein AAGJ40_07420 [Planctomycetota bacterium]